MVYHIRYCTKLKTAQHAAASVLTSTNNIELITPFINDLHWLPVKSRIYLKLLLLTFKDYHGLAPLNLYYRIDKKLPSYSLRDYDDFLLVEPRTKIKMYGDKAFSKAAPFFWNPLPIPNVACFKERIKMYLLNWLNYK